jgi:hypothetical protein
MSTSNTEQLIELISSLTKAEKRYFKLYSTRNSNSAEDLKFILLFDFIEKTENYSDELLLKRVPEIKKSQVSNLKAHLHKQLLSSLRLQHVQSIPVLEIREIIDFAHICYQKGLYQQSLRLLEKAKVAADRIQSSILKLEIIEVEKTIFAQHPAIKMEEFANNLTVESNQLNKEIGAQISYSNLSIQLYSLYLKIGVVRDEKEAQFVNDFFYSRLPHYPSEKLNFEQRLHLYNAYVYFTSITQNFVSSYRYARAWVNLFDEYPEAKREHLEMYLKGLYHLQNSLFQLRHFKRLEKVVDQIEATKEAIRENENLSTTQQFYLIAAKINWYFLQGKFTDGANLSHEIDAFIEKSGNRLDLHRTVVLNYKLGCLYFGSGNNKMAIKYLTKVIQAKENKLREDIQCFARILNLIAHYESDPNSHLLEYQIKSVYRFLSSMGNLQGVQKEILAFLRLLPFENDVTLTRGFRVLLNKLTKLAQTDYEKRPFLYLDIISWLECKINKRSVQEVIQEKFILEIETGEKKYFPYSIGLQ